MNVEIAITDEQVEACYAVMRELRPHLKAEAFIGVIRDLQREGYELAFLSDAGRVIAVVGFRTKRALFCEKFLYVDDFVTLSNERSKGYGRILLDWLKDRARSEGCAELHLDSGLHRKDAHRFYECNGVEASGYHFRMKLEERVPWAFQSQGTRNAEHDA